MTKIELTKQEVDFIVNEIDCQLQGYYDVRLDGYGSVKDWNESHYCLISHPEFVILKTLYEKLEEAKQE